MEHLFGSGSESEFHGLMREEVYFAEGSQVRILHKRGKEGDKENQPDRWHLSKKGNALVHSKKAKILC